MLFFMQKDLDKIPNKKRIKNIEKEEVLKGGWTRTKRGNQKRIRIGINLIKLSMIYGFAYLWMVLAISAGWVVLALYKKPEFIEKPL